ncbi:MAG: hypothetical protein MI747_21945 [Desulfobacterales bacterium]|nr:hypothetical protein [Desulfobacterales bacterium]
MKTRPISRPKRRRSLKAFLAPVFMALALSALLAGCGKGLPDAVTKDAESLVKRLNATEDHIRDQQKKFRGMAASDAFKPMAGYAEKENWAGGFDQATATLSRARGLYDTNLAPLIKKDNPDTVVKVRLEINRINKVIDEARAQAKAPFSRMDRIRTAMTDTRGVYEKAGGEAGAIQDRISAYRSGPVAGALAKFPGSEAKINSRFSPFEKMDEETRTGMAVMEQAYTAHQNNAGADYAAFITRADAMEANMNRLGTMGPELEKDLENLYQSYTKVLDDMKVDYFVTVKRESWNENSDYYDPRFSSFTRQVTPAVYAALADSDADTLAGLMPGYGGLNIRVTSGLGNAWQALNINPTDNWPDRRHNAASFWVENFRPAYYHKYLKEENGETAETGWVKVDPTFYEQNLDNLGMAILSKPYGEFEPDTQAAPPGMAYVGNPEYGEWKKDENGESFWSWYGRYAFFSHLFFFPPSYYYYGSWNRWNQNYRYKKPYYGKTSTGAYTYGTRGTKIKRTPRYQNTTFGRTGGFKSRPASVRGGSASLRGGGPKGKGK